MKTLLLNVKENKVEVLDVEGTLEEYYERLDCRCIDIQLRSIAGRNYDIVCDDEGLLVDNPRISAINNYGETMLVGNLMFFHNDGMGNLTGLKDEDIRHLLNNIQHMYTRKCPEGYKMLVRCEYY
jgi:hypothetical protein